jgi:sugar phosphate permease
MFAHVEHWAQAAMFAPAFLAVGVAIVRSLRPRSRPQEEDRTCPDP